VVTRSSLSDTTVRSVPGTLPKVTSVAPDRWLPLIVISVPPSADPVAGETASTLGVAAYSKAAAGTTAVVPPSVVTRTSTGPIPPAGGATTLMRSGETVTTRASASPMVTRLAPSRSVPVTETRVPPACEPEAGEIPSTTGARTNLKSTGELPGLRPVVVMTRTLTSPSSGKAGVVTDSTVSEETTRSVPGTPSKSTSTAPENRAPVTVTRVPPSLVPAAGSRPLTAGSGRSAAGVGLGRAAVARAVSAGCGTGR
jgi:hypothetical protein